MNTPQYPGPYQGPQHPYGQNQPQQSHPQPPFAYNPYSAPYQPAPGQGPEPVRRPGLMVLALILMVLAALPFLGLGVLFLVGLSASSIPPEVLNSPRLQQAGATPDLIISALRVAGGIILAVAVIYLVLGILAFIGRNWARICVAVLTVGFALLLAAGLVAGGSAIDTLSLLGVLLIMILGAVGILFSPGANAWYAYRR